MNKSILRSVAVVLISFFLPINFSAAQATDLDQDGFVDALDNCPNTANADQADTGGINTNAPDGIGDVCQCGDVNNNGKVDNTDAILIKRHVLGLPPAINLDKCNVNNGAACDNSDAIFIQRAVLGLPPGVSQKCLPALQPPDADNDNVADGVDNCINTPNTDQSDIDTDGAGDLCDEDMDGDGIANGADLCPATSDPDNGDLDGDGLGNPCDPDDDNDSVSDVLDNCPVDVNPAQSDNDLDALGDVCDGDDDNDTVLDTSDNCPLTPNAGQADFDADTVGDVCDPDDDNDSVDDGIDNCPMTPNPGQENLDLDFFGDVCDFDDDGDTIADVFDNCPIHPNMDQADLDADGLGDACDIDTDGDGIDDFTSDGITPLDNCPLVRNFSQGDQDLDSMGDLCDNDIDGDGLTNLPLVDNCPIYSNVAQLDDDLDGAGNSCDPDLDNDGIPNAVEQSYGLNPLNAADGSQDLDSDGFSNLMEYQSGTNINNAIPDSVKPDDPSGAVNPHHKVFSHDLYENDRFGQRVAISSTSAVVGAPTKKKSAFYSGEAYVFVLENGKWIQQATLAPIDLDTHSFFGGQVAIDGDTVAIGAEGAGEAGDESGAVFVFYRTGDTWTLQAKLMPNDAAPQDEFGGSIAVDGDTIAIGSRQNDNSGNGAVYLFERTSGVWSQQSKLTASDGASEDAFGFSVALDGDTLVASAWADDDTGEDAGSVYVFNRIDGVWTESQKFYASDTASLQRFGAMVAIDSETIAVGAFNFDGIGPIHPSSYIFGLDSGVWVEQGTISSGWAVSVSNDTVLVGNPEAGTEVPAYGNRGEVSVFEKTGGAWSEAYSLHPQDGTSGFGWSVDIKNDRVVVAADIDSDIGIASGAVYFFDLDLDNDGLSNFKESNLGTDPNTPDTDSDGILDADDNCPVIPNPGQEDSDSDGIGDACLPIPSFGLFGGGVKGPTITSSISTHSFTLNAGQIVLGENLEVLPVVSQSNARALLTIPGDVSVPFILQADGGIDLSTGTAPTINPLQTIVTQSMIDAGQPIYATSLTTLGIQIAAGKAGSGGIYPDMGDPVLNLLAAMPAASAETLSIAGFGANTGIDIFRQPPLLRNTDTTQAAQNDVVNYRVANEALATILDALAPGGARALLDELAADIVDDGMVSDAAPAAGVRTALLNAAGTINAAYLDDVQDDMLAEVNTVGIGTTVNTNYLLFNPGLANFVPPLAANLDGGDADGDGVLDGVDIAPLDPTSAADLDGDGIDDVLDNDPTTPGVQADLDNGDPSLGFDAGYSLTGTPGDLDEDGTPDASDACPLDPDGSVDADGDGFCAGPDDVDDNEPLANTDTDSDGVGDGLDNCLLIPNANQVNTDGDAFGDECDDDKDGDTLLNGADNCPLIPNLDQKNTDSEPAFLALWGPDDDLKDKDGDTLGDVCDPDDDNDNITDFAFGNSGALNDRCPLIPSVGAGGDNDDDGVQPREEVDPASPLFNPQSLLKGADKCDLDDDNDGVRDLADLTLTPPQPSDDNCPFVFNPGQEDDDMNGVGNICEPDIDNDGVPDFQDNCTSGWLNPLDETNPDQTDTDGDTFGDICDNNSDGDGFQDPVDNCPLIDNENQADNDSDGPLGGDADPLTGGDVCDDDDDNDGFVDDVDYCDFDNTAANLDSDGDGNALNNPDGDGDACDEDDDNDGVDDLVDICPLVSDAGQADLDGDGVPGGSADPLVGGDACDNDADGDGIPVPTDTDDFDANVSGVDADVDSVDDAIDNCTTGFLPGEVSTDPDQTDTDSDGQGDICDTDQDGDTIPNTIDPAPASLVGTAYHFDVYSLAAESFTAMDQLVLSSLSESPVGSPGPQDAIDDNVLDLGSDAMGDGTLALDRNFEELDTDLTIGGACTAGTDCTLAATPTATAATPASINDDQTVNAAYTAPAGTAVGSLAVAFGAVALEAESASSFSVETLDEHGANGTPLSGFGQSFVGTERADGRVYTLDGGCATALGLGGFPYGSSAALQADLDALVPATAKAAATGNCTETAHYSDSSILVLAPESVGASIALADFDTENYGLVEFGANFTQTTATDLVQTSSRVSALALSGGGGTVTQSAAVGVLTEVGSEEVTPTSDGQIDYDAATNVTALALDQATGELTLTRGGTGLPGVAANDRALLSFGARTAIATSSDRLERAYAVQLSTGVVAADLIGKSYDLQGLLMESSNTGLTQASYKGLTLLFQDDGGGSVEAVLSGSASLVSAVFDDANNNLPQIGTGGSESFSSEVSAVFTPAGNGHIGPIIFGALELDGFYTPNGLLLRAVRAVATEGSGGGIQFGYADPSDPDITFVDPQTGAPLVPQPAGPGFGFFIDAGSSNSTFEFTDDARVSPTPMTFSDIDTAGATAFDDYVFLQGVLFGTQR